MSVEGRNQGRRMAEKIDHIDLIEPTTGKLFFEHKSALVFCQPHIIPLKSLALERLEAMQRDTARQLQQKRLQKKTIATSSEAAAAGVLEIS